ncbi:hypothetical protein PG985_002123 [Apiospora marii]|uniref:Uncharacterized protein n=1 Tax=Apiospora marii TaxID=335849 RepID=A0ABR1RYN2_9PEZI
MSSKLLQSATRSAARTLGRTSQTSSRVDACRTGRTYATMDKPPPSQGGNNRAIGLALVGLTLPALYLYSSRSASGTHPTAAAAAQTAASARPDLDPAGKTRAKKEESAANGGQPKHMHPEDHDPAAFKPGFGRQHERKRVDGPPDARNHQELNDRNRNI